MGHMGSVSSWRAMRSFSNDPANKDKDIPAGTWKRVIGYASPYRRDLTLFIGLVVLAAIAGVATPVLAGDIVNVISSDSGTTGTVIRLASIIAGLAVFDALMSLAQRWYSARIGEGVIYDLRTQVYEHVQQMSIAFFTRAQTGALVSRLNSDVLGAQRAFTSVLSGVISNIVGLVLTVAVMLTLSWQITLMSLVLLPVFIFPARIVGQRLQKITRESYDLNASMNATMTERFNVAGALLVALFGRPEQEAESFRGRAGRVRDIGIVSAMYGRIFFVALTLVASLAGALVYGVGGVLAVQGNLDAGTVVSLALLLSRLYGPLTALSNIRVDVMSALVSFDRVFEVLDLAPGIEERPDARQLRAGSRSLEFDDVHFTYPSGEQVSLAS
ncbi:MAG: ABC transporter ATP-binding protein, partial [Geodermatophilaceae bacterium]|nr:ABC transporter ATP-binding protein [Geodermatophilaceae bacterium]